MIKPDFDGKQQSEGEIIAVTMLTGFKSSADGIGEREYAKGKTYRVEAGAFAEMERHGDEIGRSHYVYPYQISRPVFKMVKITPKVTRPCTSSGLDTLHLKTDEKISVPSNLAHFLVHCGLATN